MAKQSVATVTQHMKNKITYKSCAVDNIIQHALGFIYDNTLPLKNDVSNIGAWYVHPTSAKPEILFVSDKCVRLSQL